MAAPFSEKLRQRGGSGKRAELPFSPKKSKRVAMPAAALDKSDKCEGKENSANINNAGVRVKPQDRLSRAKKFMEERKKGCNQSLKNMMSITYVHVIFVQDVVALRVKAPLSSLLLLFLLQVFY